MSQFRSGFSKLLAAHSLSDQVVQALVARVESRQFSPGQRIPAQAILAFEFGVSRPVTRSTEARRVEFMRQVREEHLAIIEAIRRHDSRTQRMRRPLTCSMQPGG